MAEPRIKVSVREKRSRRCLWGRLGDILMAGPASGKISALFAELAAQRPTRSECARRYPRVEVPREKGNFKRAHHCAQSAHLA